MKYIYESSTLSKDFRPSEEYVGVIKMAQTCESSIWSWISLKEVQSETHLIKCLSQEQNSSLPSIRPSRRLKRKEKYLQPTFQLAVDPGNTG